MLKPIKPKMARVKDPIREPNITFANELVWKIEWNRSVNEMKDPPEDSDEWRGKPNKLELLER